VRKKFFDLRVFALRDIFQEYSGVSRGVPEMNTYLPYHHMNFLRKWTLLVV